MTSADKNIKIFDPNQHQIMIDDGINFICVDMEDLDKWFKCIDMRKYGKPSILKQLKVSMQNGYKVITFNGVIHKIHKLIADKYVRNDDETSKRFIIHVNGDKLNNDPDNLKWSSYCRENSPTIRTSKQYEVDDDEEKYYIGNGKFENVYVDINNGEVYQYIPSKKVIKTRNINGVNSFTFSRLNELSKISTALGLRNIYKNIIPVQVLTRFKTDDEFYKRFPKYADRKIKIIGVK